MDFEDVIRAYYKIQPGIVRTSIIAMCWRSLVQAYSSKDMNQITGSFKEGARNAILSLSPEEKIKGVLVLPLAIMRSPWPTMERILVSLLVLMPFNAPITKVSKYIAGMGYIILHGTYGEARDYAYDKHADLSNQWIQ